MTGPLASAVDAMRAQVPRPRHAEMLFEIVVDLLGSPAEAERLSGTPQEFVPPAGPRAKAPVAAAAHPPRPTPRTGRARTPCAPARWRPLGPRAGARSSPTRGTSATRACSREPWDPGRSPDGRAEPPARRGHASTVGAAALRRGSDPNRQPQPDPKSGPGGRRSGCPLKS